MNLNRTWLQVVVIVLSTSVNADELKRSTRQCLDANFQSASDLTTIGELRALCAEASIQSNDEKHNPTERAEDASEPSVSVDGSDSAPKEVSSLVMARIIRERRLAGTRSSLTGHNRNYMLPISYMSNTNEAPFLAVASSGQEGVELDNVEAKFQISLKTTLFDNVLLDNDAFLVGFTATSFWQVYNKDVSSPFRETDYEPEFFWSVPLNWRPWAVDATLLILGISHQSNGQAGALSRSWNRVYANFVWEKSRFVFSFKPWYRIPENEKAFVGDPSGDDNPDIKEYMGSFEFSTGYRSGNHEVTTTLRNNLRSDNRGALQVEWTFPLWKNVRGYAQYFNGYGENLIDYNSHTERVGVGFLLTDLL